MSMKSGCNPLSLILNSPSNPTGAGYTRTQLERIAEVALRHQVIVISDEIYEKVIFDGMTHFSIGSIDGMSTPSFHSHARW